METLLYLALWGGLIFFMMRFGCGAHMMGHRHGRKEDRDQPKQTERTSLRWVAPARDVDPVCGRTVRTEAAKSSVYAGTVHYFCSRECREVFEAAPDLYLGGDRRRRKVEQSHA